MLNADKYKSFLQYDRIKKEWFHKDKETEWEPISLELHETYNSTEETEINHPGLIDGYIESENKHMEEKVLIKIA